MPLETPASCPLPLSLDFPLLAQIIIFLRNPQLHSWNSIILSGFSQFNTYLGSIYFDIYYFRNISTLKCALEIYIDPKSHMGKLTLFLQFCCLRPGVLWSELASNHSRFTQFGRQNPHDEENKPAVPIIPKVTLFTKT